MLRTADICCWVRLLKRTVALYHSLAYVAFLDIVDYYEPVMLIVGSRGLGNLKGYVLAHHLSPARL